MRLIDADTVKQDIYKYIKEEGRLINPYRMLDYIDSVKTSKKAIPTEWIEQFMNRFRLDMVTSDEYALLHFMLTEWENENEISTMPVSDDSTIPLDYLGERK